MGLGGGLNCIKYSLFAFDLLVGLAGTAVLSIALWLRFDKATQSFFQLENSPSAFFIGVYVLIVAGAVMMVVGFLGCCGSIKESPCMLGLFFAFLLSILAAEVAAGIWGLSNKDKIVRDVKQFYNETYQNYKSTNQMALKDGLIGIQYALQCCGPTGTPADGISDTCPQNTATNQIVTTSCPIAINTLLNSKMHVIGGVGIGIGLIMIFGMIFSMILCCAIKRTRDIV